MKQSSLKAFLKPAYLEALIFPLLILLLPTQLGKHFWPEWSYVYSLKIDYLAVTIYLWDLLLYGLIFVWLFQKSRINKLAGLFLLISLVTSVISMFFSTSLVGISRLVNMIPASLFALYLSSKSAGFIRQQIDNFLPWTIIWTASLALLQIVFGKTIGFWLLGERNFDLLTPGIATFNWYGQVFLRPYATFPHPNVLAAFILLAGLIILFISRVGKKWLLIIQMAVLGTIIASFSRASIAVATVLSVFLLRKYFVYLFLVFILLSPLLYIRFDSAFNFDQLSLVRREELAQTAWKITQTHPWVGVGFNNYIPTAVSASFLSGTNRFLQPVHNIFLLTLSETGIIGLMGFIIFLFSPLCVSIDNRLLSRSQVGGLILIISFLGMIDHYFLTLPQGQRVLFLIWGLSWVRR
jgi:hypothetical protein